VDEVPATRYAAVGDADVAYQEFGDGPVDLVHTYGLGSHVELNWDSPADADVFRRLGSIARVVVFDKRGTGASDAVTRTAIRTWEDWAEDFGAVLDAVGWERAAISAEVEAGPMAMLYAATHPERVSALVLANTTARFLVAPDYPIGFPPEVAERGVRFVGRLWGTIELARFLSPSLDGDETSLRNFARCQRASATPRNAEAQFRYAIEADVREALALIQAPTLVVHVADNSFYPLVHGEYLAEHIPNATLAVLDASDTSPTMATDQYIDALSAFLTGDRPGPEPDRVLATVLFTDIVDSTGRAADMGDGRWRQLLDTHDRVVGEQLDRYAGQEINTTGDGFVATFEGPARAIRCGRAIVETLARRGIVIRGGVHTGECERRGRDLAGLAVHVAARVAAAAEPSEILVTATVRDLVLGSGLKFRDAGTRQLKGVPGTWALYTNTS
jgi:class 3 adenylate cyclase